MNSDFDSSSGKKEDVKTALTKERSFWRLPVIENLLRSFSSGDRLVLYALGILLGLSTLFLIAEVNNSVSVEVPAHGGSLTEGEVGPARFINPVLTLSQPDEDLTALVYSGLMRATAEGTYVPDLAQNYDISEDGSTYTFHLRPNATFHDGTKVTSVDVLFTVHAAQNPVIKSPRRADWEGVQVSAPDAETVVFKLPHAYAPFMDNATMGILPEHIWSAVPAEEFPFSPANTHPVGSGPYRVTGVSTDNTGSPIRYDLAPFTHFTLGEANLRRISFVFFSNESAMVQAYNNRRIDAMAGISPEDLATVKRDDGSVIRVALPRVFGIFFNQSHAAVLADASVREALDAAVDKTQLVKTILGGYGVTLDGPIPPGVSGDIVPATPMTLTRPATVDATTTPDSVHVEAAKSALTKGGWKYSETTGSWTKGKQTLSFTLATADQPQLVATAQAVAAAWNAAGIRVTVQVYPLSEFNTNVIRPRQYDALLFGEVVGRTLDLFAFWHSTQRNDPGLNLAMYANSKVDALLSQARATTDNVQRDKLYGQFAAAVEKDAPAVFLYSPQFVYVVPKALQGIELGALTTPAERFLGAYQWYTQTEHVWSMFTNRIN